MSSRDHPSRKRNGIPPKDRPSEPDLASRFAKLEKLVSQPRALSNGLLCNAESSTGTLESVGREADAAYAGVKRIIALLNTESKACDVSGTGTFDRDGLVINLAGAIAQGVADNQRTGDSIKIQYVELLLYVYASAASTAMTWVLGKSKDSTPVASQIFSNTGSAYSGLALKNWDEKSTDHWVKSKTVDLISGSAATEKFSFVWRHRIKIDDHTQYSAASTTVTSGALWLALVCGLTTTALPTYVLQARVVYVDN